MRRSLVLGMTVIGGAIAFGALSPVSRRRLSAGMRRRMRRRIERVMASLPEDVPPKLIMSVLPRLRAQNDRIISLLQEQNELLREQLHARRDPERASQSY